MTGSTTLICPKCRGEMRAYERNGVMVDQCEECRGIFFDRGELEQLLDAAQGSGHTGDHRDDGAMIIITIATTMSVVAGVGAAGRA